MFVIRGGFYQGTGTYFTFLFNVQKERRLIPKLSLNTIERSQWIDSAKLKEFILSTQDKETGGFADRPGDYPDPFHTLFGLAALSLMQHKGEITLPVQLDQIDPLFCMPKSIIERL